jgi:hypothetical protein
MKPNHHYAVHLPQQLRNFGPVYEFWTFLTEWLNKILKAYNSNFWGGSQLEVSMMQHFNCKVSVHNLVSFSSILLQSTTTYRFLQAVQLHANPDHEATKIFIGQLFSKASEDRGTIEATGSSDVSHDSTYHWLKKLVTKHGLQLSLTFDLKWDHASQRLAATLMALLWRPSRGTIIVSMNTSITLSIATLRMVLTAFKP